MVDENQLEELVLQSLEHERGGVQVYETALKCAIDQDLAEEWQKYLEQTKRHVEIVEGLCRRLGFDETREIPGRAVVRHLGSALVSAMDTARANSKPEAAQLVACECVVLAETKDHLDWELLCKCAAGLEGDKAAAVQEACDEIEKQEDEHLYHTQGWCRELWIESLGMKAQLPPPEERQQAHTKGEAARAQQKSERLR
jgi:hypothetical protein